MDREYLIQKMQKYLTKLEELGEHGNNGKFSNKEKLYKQKFEYYYDLLVGGGYKPYVRKELKNPSIDNLSHFFEDIYNIKGLFYNKLQEYVLGNNVIIFRNINSIYEQFKKDFIDDLGKNSNKPDKDKEQMLNRIRINLDNLKKVDKFYYNFSEELKKFIYYLRRSRNAISKFQNFQLPLIKIRNDTISPNYIDLTETNKEDIIKILNSFVPMYKYGRTFHSSVNKILEECTHNKTNSPSNYNNEKDKEIEIECLFSKTMDDHKTILYNLIHDMYNVNNNKLPDRFEILCGEQVLEELAFFILGRLNLKENHNIMSYKKLIKNMSKNIKKRESTV